MACGLASAIDGGRWRCFVGLCAGVEVEGLLGGVAGGAEGAAAGAVGFETQIGVQVIDHCGGIVLAAMNLRQQQVRHRQIRIVEDGFAGGFFGFDDALRGVQNPGKREETRRAGRFEVARPARM